MHGSPRARRAASSTRLPPFGLHALVLLAALVAGASSRARGDGPASVDAGFAGGNIIVEKIDGDTFFVHQDLRDTARDWFYWHFRVRGAGGRTLTFRFTRGDAFGPLGPACSTDGGKSWHWLGPDRPETSFVHRFAPREGDVRFAFCIPYTEEHLTRFLQTRPGAAVVKSEVLCKSAKGRRVELLRFGAPTTSCRHRVLLTARHHACETMANYVLEGLIDAVLTDPTDGRWLRERVELVAVPFMDKDGVEEGDQGKLRAPHDHWEDYAGQSRYAEVRALREFVPRWSQRKLRLALDLHCPARLDNFIFLAAPRSDSGARRVGQLAVAVEAVSRPVFPARSADLLPFGKNWNTATYYGARKPFMLWAEELDDAPAAATLEMPYARVGKQPVTVANAIEFGKCLARAIRLVLEPIARD